ncbi:MAG TPA: hypothetical protein VGP57_17520 [Actinoplanes sp.]|nr:hypothetical protein [Actinoplanes sp.]
MTLSGSRARRLAVVESYQLPGGARQRFAFQHEDLTPEQLRLVEAGALQWFRVAARRPRARLSMPSVAVDGLWHEFVLDTGAYADFCAAAFGRVLRHPSEPVTNPAALHATFLLAQRDESAAPAGLPLLFRVDSTLAVPGGHRYLADCGGRDQCYPLPDTVCLHHLKTSRRRHEWDYHDGPRATTSDLGGTYGEA